MNALLPAQLLTIPWILSEVLVFRRDKQAGGGSRKDVGSRAGIFAGIAIGLWLSFALRAARIGLLPGSPWLWVALGAALVFGGIVFRAAAVRQLGAFFRTHVTLLDEHRLVTTGLYRHLRHPSYSGALITNAGIGLSLGSWATLLVMLLVPGLAYAYRIRVEERMLAERFGADWQAHRSRTSALIPGLW